MTEIVKKYFGRPPEDVKKVVAAITEANVSETDTSLTGSIKVNPEALDGVTEEMIKKVSLAEEAFRAAAAAAVVNLKKSHPDKKVKVNMTVGDVYEVTGSTLKDGKVVTRVRNIVDVSEYDKFYEGLDGELTKILSKK